MNPLIKKEIRLLLPAWIGAMILAIVPYWIVEFFDADVITANVFRPPVFIMFGMLFLGITSFGSEISFKTFPLLLSQPVPRGRIWWTKISLLGTAFLSILAASMISWSLLGLCHLDHFPGFLDAFGRVELWIYVFAFFLGSLWTTLLLRQTIGAFWMTLFVPVAILMVINIVFFPWSVSDAALDAIVSAVFVAYSIAGFIYAKNLFMQAQDTQWLEGEFSFTWRKTAPEQATRSILQGQRHWLPALMFKEIQLHQVNILIAVVVLVLHIASVVVRKIHPHFDDPYIKGVLDQVWSLWLLVPLLIGCSAIAEERKLGVMESQLCLPVSRLAQMFVKFFVALVLSLALGVLMPLLIDKTETGFPLIFVTAAIFFISFYASSLSRTTIQAVGVAIFVGALLVLSQMALLALLSTLASNSFIAQHQFYGYQLLYLWLGFPLILLVLGWLALWNFKWLHPTMRLWRRNLLVILAPVVFVYILVNGIYFRAWELLMPVQPPPGPVRLTNPSKVKISITVDACYANLPDGRLWQGYPYYLYVYRSSELRFLVPAGSRGEFVGGSNWTEVAEDEYQGLGIRSDGSLWSLQRWNPSRNQWQQNGPFTLAQIGQDANWSQVASGSMGFWLLKKDGSLWIWGTNSYDWHQGFNAIPKKLKLDLTTAPTRIGDETNWTQLFSQSGDSPSARQNNGTVWHWAGWVEGTAHYSYALAQNTNLDNQWSNFSLSRDRISFVMVKTNGELWLSRNYGRPEIPKIQLGRDHSWKTAGFTGSGGILAIRDDGTLWKWPFFWRTETPRPVQLGRQADWIALANDDQIGLALAADGSIWAWDTPSGHVWLAPSRRPAYMGNIFQGTSENP